MRIFTTLFLFVLLLHSCKNADSNEAQFEQFVDISNISSFQEFRGWQVYPDRGPNQLTWDYLVDDRIIRRFLVKEQEGGLFYKELLKDRTQEYTTLDESFVDSIANFSIDLCRQYLDLDVESIIYDERYDHISVKINDIYSMIIILGDKTKAEALLSRFVKIDNKRYYIKHHP